MTSNKAPSIETAPTLILTNDDGWDAPGLAALRQAAATLGRCRIVAPIGPDVGLWALRHDARAPSGDPA